MSKKIVIWLLTTVFLTTAPFAEAQQTAKVPRIGYLAVETPSAIAARTEGFRQGLNKLGYREGQNIVIEYKYADGKRDQLDRLAAELVRLKVEVIVAAGGDGVANAAKNASRTIPIVMTNVAAPVVGGFVTSLARPEGNVTGLTSMTFDLSGKRLELLKETFPKVSRVAVLYDPDDPTKVIEFKEILQPTARALAVRLQTLEARSPEDFESAFRAAIKGHAGALIVLPTGVTNSNRTRIAELATSNRLPAMYPDAEFVDTGGLMAYGTSYIDLYRRAATYLDKILKGTKPADLPVEQPMKFEFIVNLKAAKQIGLTIPPNVLVRANRVIR
jgi:ABC-type uncharacterized transport system substrate-binding protein